MKCRKENCKAYQNEVIYKQVCKVNQYKDGNCMLSQREWINGSFRKPIDNGFFKI